MKAAKDVSLLWIWAKVQGSFVQPVLPDGERVLLCLQRGPPVTLELMASVQAACSMDALSSSPSDMKEHAVQSPGYLRGSGWKPTAS